MIYFSTLQRRLLCNKAWICYLEYIYDNILQNILRKKCTSGFGGRKTDTTDLRRSHCADSLLFQQDIITFKPILYIIKIILLFCICAAFTVVTVPRFSLSNCPYKSSLQLLLIWRSWFLRHELAVYGGLVFNGDSHSHIIFLPPAISYRSFFG